MSRHCAEVVYIVSYSPIRHQYRMQSRSGGIVPSKKVCIHPPATKSTQSLPSRRGRHTKNEPHNNPQLPRPNPQIHSFRNHISDREQSNAYRSEYRNEGEEMPVIGEITDDFNFKRIIRMYRRNNGYHCRYATGAIRGVDGEGESPFRHFFTAGTGE
jgi:hypothetical protein